MKITTIELEIALARYLNPRVNLIVPNVSWGFFNHECDIISVSKAGYATEYELKISKADLKADFRKKHDHSDNKIKALFYVFPEYLRDCIELIPDKAGILLASRHQVQYSDSQKAHDIFFHLFRDAEMTSKPYKLNEADRYQIARLGAMRIWGLKEKIINKDAV